MSIHKMAESAFNNVSFDPDGRAATFEAEFERENRRILALCGQYGISPDKFIKKHEKLASAYLASESRCASWAITGPSRFPARTMEKRATAAHKHLAALVYFRENVERMLKRISRRNETQDDKKSVWLQKIEQLEKLHAQKKDINALIRKGKRQEIEDKYNTTLPVNFFGFPDYDLRNELANIRRLKAQVAEIDRARETKAESGFEFDGGRVEFEPEEIRYNVYFDEKPKAELRDKLKSRGFKWSPKREAWTRGAKTISIEIIKAILLEEARNAVH
ncbi:MAG: hypothetical protein Q4P84_01210 [Elusimicrobiales bacterium]|nr:hypothetical protein [Elusimicrobiales bacterium]